MIGRVLFGCAALMCAAAAHATPERSKITTTADGSVWYFEDSSVRPLDGSHPGLLQFWVHSDNPPSQSVRHWGIRIYLDCATMHYMKSSVWGYDANGHVLQWRTYAVTPQAWITQDPTGMVGLIGKKICPSR